MRFYNFRTNDVDEINKDFYDDNSDYSDYVGDKAIHENLYNLYIIADYSPIEAAIKVLERQVDVEG